MNTATDITPLPDYHLHTALCRHAEGSPAQYRAIAARRGIPQICFTDHMPTYKGYDPAHRMEMPEFDVYRDMISGLGQGPGPEVLFGIEADYYEGCEGFLEKWLPEQSFDLVIGSVHFIDDWGFDNPEHRHVWDSVDIRETWKKYFELIGRLADSGLYDVVGHIDLPKKFGHRPPEEDLRGIVSLALDKIAGAGMALEVNTAGLRKTVKEIYPSRQILELARERGIPLCFGSDAHRPEEVGFGFADALSLARLSGYTEYFRISGRGRTAVPLPPLSQ